MMLDWETVGDSVKSVYVIVVSLKSKLHRFDITRLPGFLMVTGPNSADRHCIKLAVLFVIF